MKTEIVVEIGINHNGSIATAKDMIRVAKDCGADTCKFQVFEPWISYDGDDELYRTLTRNWFADESILEFRDYCHQQNIDFLCSAFDRPSIDLLVQIGEKRIKIPSSRNTILPYIKYVLKQPFETIIWASGASGAEGWGERLSMGTKTLIPVECISAYPCDPSKFVVHDLQEPWGLSDHSRSWEACIAAVAKGACYIEKHFTLDKSAKGPDHRASLDPNEFTKMVTEIRNVERMLANTDKVVLPEEQATVARKARHNVDQYK